MYFNSSGLLGISHDENAALLFFVQGKVEDITQNPDKFFSYKNSVEDSLFMQ